MERIDCLKKKCFFLLPRSHNFMNGFSSPPGEYLGNGHDGVPVLVQGGEGRVVGDPPAVLGRAVRRVVVVVLAAVVQESVVVVVEVVVVMVSALLGLHEVRDGPGVEGVLPVERPDGGPAAPLAAGGAQRLQVEGVLGKHLGEKKKQNKAKLSRLLSCVSRAT